MTSESLIIATALGLYAVVVVSPGPSFALVSRLAIANGRITAFGATCGLALAATFYAILTMTGLALLLTRMGWLAALVQIAGGCYLIYLGATAWLSRSPEAAALQMQAGSTGPWRGFRTGLLVNLSNPKAIAFFIGFYAAAIPLQTALWAKLVILLGGFLLELIWYGLVAVLMSSRPARKAYERFGRWIERSIGTLLGVFGLRLIAEKL
jgi:threonine/homoserine/homoserine lactone efflux protein